MDFIIDPATKQSYQSLFGTALTVLPSLDFGATVAVNAALCSPISPVTTNQYFNPVDSSAWTMRAGVGLGFLPPVAGTWFVRSNVPITSGTVTNAKRFKIVNFVAGDVFTNIGASSNATGVVFTSTGTTPTTWTHGSELQECTANLAYNATASDVNTALNATAFITADGGVTVTALEGASNYFAVTFATAGNRPALAGEAGGLAPLSDVDTGTLLDGDTQNAEVQTLRVAQSPATFADLTTPFPAKAITVDPVQAGGGGANQQTRFTLSPIPYGGQWTISLRGMETAFLSVTASASDVVTALQNLQATSGLLITGAKYKIVTFAASDDFTNVGGTNVTGNVFVATATTPTTWTHGSILSPVASGNVQVSAEASNKWLVMFVGDMANTDMGTITASATGVLVMNGWSGNLPLDVPGVELLLGDSTSKTVSFSIRGQNGSGPVQILYAETCTLNATIFTPGSETPQPADQFLSFTNGNLLPTSDPHVNGYLWNNGGVVCVSAG